MSERGYGNGPEEPSDNEAQGPGQNPVYKDYQLEDGSWLRRIVLPSGKMIEAVYFDQPPNGAEAENPAQSQEATKARDLHICDGDDGCGSDLVYPTTWEEADEKHWQVCLRCPNCEHFEQGIFTQDECDRFDDHLEAGTDALTRDFKRLMAANMAEDIDKLVTALDADGIHPMDFGTIPVSRQIEIDQELRNNSQAA